MTTFNSYCRYYSTENESELRFFIDVDAAREAIKNKLVSITDMCEITQKWVISGDEYYGRIRKTYTPKFKKNQSVTTKYEHTVKYKTNKNLCLEVTSEIDENIYHTLFKKFKNIKAQEKTRFTVTSKDPQYKDYKITFDFPTDDESLCIVEFERNDVVVNETGFIVPEWIKGHEKKRS